MMPHPERALETLLGTDSGVKLFEAMVKVGGNNMSKFIEPSVEEIKLEKVYQDMGLSDQEYEKVCDILGRQPNFTETGIFSVMWSEHCSYKHSKTVFKAISYVR